MAAFRYSKWLLLLFCSVSLVCVGFCQYGPNRCEGKLDKCFCSDNFIYCNGQEFTNIKEIYPFVTGFTYRISIVDGKLESIPSDLFAPVAGRIAVDHLENVTFLNFSGNGIKNFESGAFDLLPNLGTLDLSDNAVPVDRCDGQNALAKSFEPLQVLKQLHLRSALCKDSTATCDMGNVFGSLNMTGLETLDLSNNGFSVPGKKFETFMSNALSLTHLNLSHNSFTSFVYGSGFENLIEYDFSYNKMDFLTARETDEIEAMPLLTSMKIGGNPFHCDCRMNDAYDWFNSTDRPMDFEDIICKYGENDGVVGQPIMSLKLDDFCGEPEIIICYGPDGPIAVARTTAWVIVVAAVALIVITIISLVLFVRHRRRRNHDSRIPASSNQRDNKNPSYTRMV